MSTNYFDSEKMEEDLTKVLNLKQGRRFLLNLLHEAGIYSLSFRVDNPDPSITAFVEGNRNLGLKLLGSINKTSEHLYLKMLKEGVN